MFLPLGAPVQYYFSSNIQRFNRSNLTLHAWHEVRLDDFERQSL